MLTVVLIVSLALSCSIALPVEQRLDSKVEHVRPIRLIAPVAPAYKNDAPIHRLNIATNGGFVSSFAPVDEKVTDDLVPAASAYWGGGGWGGGGGGWGHGHHHGGWGGGHIHGGWGHHHHHG